MERLIICLMNVNALFQLPFVSASFDESDAQWNANSFERENKSRNVCVCFFSLKKYIGRDHFLSILTTWKEEF